MVERGEARSNTCWWLVFFPGYWPQLHRGETTLSSSPLIDLLFLLSKKSRNQSFGQLINLSTGAVTEAVGLLTSKAASPHTVQKVLMDRKTSPSGTRLSGQTVHLNVGQTESDVSVHRLLVSC